MSSPGALRIARAAAAIAAIVSLTGHAGWAPNTVVAQAAPPQFAPREEDPKDYPAGPGRDDTFYACTACHAFRLVAQQGLTREQWDESLTWMTVRHNMPEITGKDREVILDYLSAQFSPKAQPGARAWKNPFAPQ